MRAGGGHVLLLLLLRMALAEAAVMLLLLLGIGCLGPRARGREALAHLGRTLRACWTAEVASATSCAHGRLRTWSAAGKRGPLRWSGLRRCWSWALAEMRLLGVQDLG